MEQFWGVLSAVLGLSAFVPYVLAILRKPGKIRPDRVSYLIWSGQAHEIPQEVGNFAVLLGATIVMAAIGAAGLGATIWRRRRG